MIYHDKIRDNGMKFRENKSLANISQYTVSVPAVEGTQYPTFQTKIKLWYVST